MADALDLGSSPARGPGSSPGEPKRSSSGISPPVEDSNQRAIATLLQLLRSGDRAFDPTGLGFPTPRRLACGGTGGGRLRVRIKSLVRMTGQPHLMSGLARQKRGKLFGSLLAGGGLRRATASGGWLARFP